MEIVPEERRLIPSAIDYLAQVDPHRTFCFLPNGDELHDGFFELSYAGLAAAVDATAWWLDESCGGKLAGSDFPTVAYMGENDFRYILLTVAAAKTRRKVWPILWPRRRYPFRTLLVCDVNA